jgi:hypothetical protein
MDYGAFYKRLQREVRTSADFGLSVAAMMDWGSGQLPHSDWSRLAVFDAAKEIQSAKRWLPRILKREPCRFTVRGAFIGLGEFQDSDGIEFADLYFGLMSAYDPADPKLQWLFSTPRHYPSNAYLASKALQQGGLLCNRKAAPPGLGTPGHICFSVSFASLLLRHALDGDVFRTIGGTAPIGVVTGFDSGDLLHLGEITNDGFIPNKKRMV